MERRITRRQALGAARHGGAALLVVARALTALGRARGGRSGRRRDDGGGGCGHPGDDRGPLLDRRDAAPLRRAREHGAAASSSAGVAQAGVPLALRINVLDAAERRRDQRRPRRHLARQRGRPLLRRGQQTRRHDEHERPELPARLPGHRRRRRRRLARRSTARSTSRRSGRAGTRAARSTSTCASAPTTAARSRPNYTTQIFFSDADNARCSRARRPTTRARRRPIRRPTRPTTSSQASAARDEHRLRHRQHRRRLRRDVHDRPQRRRLERRHARRTTSPASITAPRSTRPQSGARPSSSPCMRAGRCDAPTRRLVREARRSARRRAARPPGTHSLRVALGKGRRRRRRDR